MLHQDIASLQTLCRANIRSSADVRNLRHELGVGLLQSRIAGKGRRHNVRREAEQTIDEVESPGVLGVEC